MAGIDQYPFDINLDDQLGSFAPKNIPARRLRPTELNIKPTICDAEQDESEAVNKDCALPVHRYVEVATLITENFLSHPFVVLRRQCQVQPSSIRWHIVPFSLVPVVLRLHQTQGISVLWKGLGSCLLVRGMTLAVEDSLSKFTPWPKDINSQSSLKSICQHIALKCVSLAIITPFYSASLVEAVQSDVASEKPGLFDVFKEGVRRIVRWGSPVKGRMLSVCALIGPTVLHGVFKYFIYLAVRGVASKTMHLKNRAEQSRRGALYKDCMLNEDRLQNIEVTASFIGLVASEVLCYPLETILHRLHLQGTRTIVDNLDTGSEVVAILTAYEGVGDCYSSIMTSEGVTGLYKGFGALILQFSIHWAVIRLTRAVVSHCATLFKPPPMPAPLPTPNTAYQAAYITRTITPL